VRKSPLEIGSATLALLLALALPSLASGPKIEKRTLVSEGETRVYYLFVPSASRPSGPLPLIVTLHGSGRDGESLVSRWRNLAEEEGIVLAGPDSTDSRHWGSPQDGPAFLRDLVEDVRRSQPVDPRRVYLFGHSAGALFALQMASLESEYFAAAAIHGGALLSSQFSIFDYARRKLPIHMTIGDQDAFFPIADARATRDVLRERGFPVELVEMRWHTHDYYGSSAKINQAAWGFLSKQVLPEDPRYTPYQNPR
jgi:poly(3-hydroxybutyrate) depolymerase